MEEIKKYKKKFLFLITSSLFFCNNLMANIYQTSCKTVESKNKVKSLSFVFSFDRKNIVINQINNKKVKYKIGISSVENLKKFQFIAQDEYFNLNYKKFFMNLKLLLLRLLSFRQKV